jgi:diacylglycerol kinase (ATP)
MLNNKPKYSLFKNSSYAISGLVAAIKSENSFKIELLLAIPIFIAISILDINTTQKLILICSAILVPIVELINSSIESVVDLVTDKIHPLAKKAKDIAAAAVLLSITLHIVCWIVILI